MARHQDRTHNQLPKDWNAAEREKQVVALRLQGLEFAAIAEQVGYANGSSAHKAWKRVLARMPLVETEQARKEQEQRLNIALAAVWDKVKTGDMWAIDRMLALEKRRAELLGLDIVRSPAGRPPEEVRREYVGVPVGAILNGHHQEIRAEGSSTDALHN